MPDFDPLLQWLGIPPDARPVDYYGLLGLRRFEDDPQLIWHAAEARKLRIRQYLNGPHAKEAEELLSLIDQAQACLLNPQRKSAYDWSLARKVDVSQAESDQGTGWGLTGAELDDIAQWERLSPSLRVWGRGRSPGKIGDATGAGRAAERPESAGKNTPGRAGPTANIPASGLRKPRSGHPVGRGGGDVSSQDSGSGGFSLFGRTFDPAELAEYAVLGAVGLGCLIMLLSLVYLGVFGNIRHLGWRPGPNTSEDSAQQASSKQAKASGDKLTGNRHGSSDTAWSGEKLPKAGSEQAGKDRAAGETNLRARSPADAFSSADGFYNWPPETPAGDGQTLDQADPTQRRVPMTHASQLDQSPQSDGSGTALKLQRSDVATASKIVSSSEAGGPKADGGGGQEEMSREGLSASIAEKLSQLVDLQFFETPLQDALATVSKQFGIHVELDEQRCREVGVAPDMPVSVLVEKVPLEEALQQLVEPLGLEPVYVRDTVRVVPREAMTGEPAKSERAIPFPLEGAQLADVNNLPDREEVRRVFQYVDDGLPPVQVSNEKIAEILIRSWGLKSASEFPSVISKVRHAKEVLLLLQVFERSISMSPEEKDRLNDLMQAWKVRAEGNLVRLGTDWLSPKEWLDRRNKARQAFIQGMILLRAGRDQGLLELEKAARLDPEFVSAHFVLGMYRALREADYLKAASHFQQAMRRCPGAISLLNNLAVCRYRTGSVNAALNYFRQAVQAGGSPEVYHNIDLILRLDEDRIRTLNPVIRKGFTELSARAFLQVGDKVADSPNSQGFLFMRYNRMMLRQDGWVDVAKDSRPVGTESDGSEMLDLVGIGTAFLVAPGHALTSRRLVAGSDKLLLVRPGQQETIGWAEIAALPEGEDTNLALLRCPQLRGKPLPLHLKSDYRKVGTEVVVIGYPQLEELGSSLKRIFGVVVAEPSVGPANHYFLSTGSHDLSGYDGGPVIDRTGSVIGVFTMSLGSDRFFEPVAAAVPTVFAARLFQMSGVPVPRATTDTSGERSWDNLLLEMEQSIVLVRCYCKPLPSAALGDTFVASLGSQVSERSPLCDPWCPRCNGRGLADCPNPTCGNGSISTTRERVIGVDPATGQPVIIREPTRVPCGVCGGKGRVPCPACGGGRLLRVTPQGN